MFSLIPRPLHAVLDYGYGLAAFVAPKAFCFDGDDAASWTSAVVGGAALVSGMVTKHEGGLVKKVPFNTHLKLDFVSALLTAATPWLFGFAANKRARNAIVGFALLELVVAALSKPDPQ